MPKPTLPRTGAQYDLAAGDYRATITELGAGLRSLSYRGEPVIAGYQADDVPPAGAGQLLLPWPNRIDHGRYVFGGATYQLDISEPARDTAIHGLTRFASWQATSQDAAQVELGLRLLGRPGYPFCLDLRASYRLTAADGLQVTISAANPGSRPAPFGTGSHPYLRAGEGPVDGWDLELPATHWLPTDDRGIPAGSPRPVEGSGYDFGRQRRIGGTALDTGFTGLSRGSDGRVRTTVTGPSMRVTLWAGPGYGWLQVFTGDALGPEARRRALAVEPMTCPPNAFVSGVDLVTIEPGEGVTRQWGIEAASLN